MKRATWILWSVLISAGLAGGGCSEEQSSPPLAPEPEPTYTDITATQAADLIHSRAELVIVDVSLYWDLGHIPGAICYPVVTTSFPAALERWEKEGIYLIYGRTDDRSIAAAEQMLAAGFHSVYRLDGNFAAWLEAGLPFNRNAPT